MAAFIGCMLPLVIIFGAVSWLAHTMSQNAAAQRRRQERIVGRLLQLIVRLASSPSDGAVVEKIVAATVDARWVPAVRHQPCVDLWKKALTFAFEHLELPSGQAIAYRVVVPLVGSPSSGAAEFVDHIRGAISSNPTNRAIHNTVLTCLRSSSLDPAHRQWLYDRMLDLVQQSPRCSELSVVALETGRWHFGSSRLDGKITIYDEQAIQNDIAVRRGSP